MTHPARRVWQALETVHAVTYFSPQPQEAARTLGLKGFWMGYFAFRAAPLGTPTAGTVEATFAVFSPRRVRRAIPDAWTLATSESCLQARRTATAAALRSAGVDPLQARDIAERLGPVVASLDTTGRPLGAANAALPLPDDPVERLWQLATTLREHRGDGHIASYVAEGLSGLEASVLQATLGDAVTTSHVVRASRGWADEEWDAAAAALRGRGQLDPATLARIEARTDALAWSAGLSALGQDGATELVASLQPLVLAAAALVEFPNPIGLPNPAADAPASS